MAGSAQLCIEKLWQKHNYLQQLHLENAAHLNEPLTWMASCSFSQRALMTNPNDMPQMPWRSVRRTIQMVSPLAGTSNTWIMKVRTSVT